jgi:hypothetical protein
VLTTEIRLGVHNIELAIGLHVALMRDCRCESDSQGAFQVMAT